MRVGDGPVETLNPRCAATTLQRGPDGEIAAKVERKTFRLDDAGTWQEADVPWLLPAPTWQGHTLKGMDLEAGRDATWYQPAGGAVFFWKGRPVYFGGWGVHDTGASTRNVYLVPQADGTHRELFEDCRGYPLRGTQRGARHFVGFRSPLRCAPSPWLDLRESVGQGLFRDFRVIGCLGP